MFPFAWSKLQTYDYDSSCPTDYKNGIKKEANLVLGKELIVPEVYADALSGIPYDEHDDISHYNGENID
jgi:hypothetical protein